MSIAPVGSPQGNASTATGTTLAITYSPTAGNTLVVVTDALLAAGAVVSVVDNATGGSSSYFHRSSQASSLNTTECWSTNPGGVKAGATTITITFTTTHIERTGVCSEYSGVVAIGQNNVNTGTASPMTVAIAIEQNGNYVVAGLGAGALETVTVTVGTARGAQQGTTVRLACVDNTSASEVSLSCTATLSTGTSWAAAAVELISLIIASDDDVPPMQMSRKWPEVPWQVLQHDDLETLGIPPPFPPPAHIPDDLYKFDATWRMVYDATPETDEPGFVGRPPDAQEPEDVLKFDATGWRALERVEEDVQVTLYGGSWLSFPSASDNFNRADGPIGPNWTTLFGFGPIAIVSDAAGSDINANAGGLYSAIIWGADQKAQATIVGLPDETLGVLVRGDSPTGNYYFGGFNVAGFGTGKYYIAYSANGSGATLVSSAVAGQVGDVVTLSAVGTLLKLNVNGTDILSVNDSKLASGEPGLSYVTISTFGGFWDNWSGASLSGIPLQFPSPPPTIEGDEFDKFDASWLARQYLGTVTIASGTTGSDDLVMSFSDQIVMSDSNLLGYGFAIADTLVLSDSTKLVFSLNFNVAETLTISDSQALGYGFSITDTLALADSATLVFGLSENIAETLTLSDAQYLGYGFAISDTLTLSDSAVIAFGLNESVTETLTLSDFQLLGYGFAITDTLVLSDSDVVVLGLNETFSDTLVLSDSVNFNFADDFSFSETFTITDSQSLGYGFIIADTLTLSDAFSISQVLDEVLTDTMVLSDSTIIVFGLNSSITETLTISDSQTLGYGFLISDALALSDSASFVLSLSLNITETLTISDSMSLGYGFAISDSLVLSDSTVVVLGIVELFSDQLIFSDSLEVGYGNGLVEQLTFTDSQSIGYGLQIADTLTFSDSFAIAEQLNLNVTETLTLSDSQSLGYGFSVTDTLALSDSDVIVLGFVELFSDTLVLSDSLIVGEGQGIVESLVFVDVNAIGYGDLISDTLVLSDAMSFQLSSGNALTLSDDNETNWNDFLAIGYGDGITDSVFNEIDTLFYRFAKNATAGGPDKLSTGDNLVINLKDSDVVVLGATEVLSDSESSNWSDALNYGFGFSDTLTFSDALEAGYGDSMVESLVFTDSNEVGYGDLVADTLVLSDSMSLIFGLNFNVAETLTISDSESLGYGFLISDTLILSDSVTVAEALDISVTETLTLSDSKSIGYGLVISETLVLSESLELGISEGIVEQLFLLDYPAVGYGDIVSDSLNNWLDAFAFTTSTPTITLNVSDAMSFSDFCAAGYGNEANDQNSMSDVLSLLESFQVLLTDATPAMLELAQLLFTTLLGINETLVISEQLGLAYGFSIDDQIVLSDQLLEQMAAVLFLALQDTETAAWLDALIAEFVFAPGGISLSLLSVLLEMVAQVSVQGQIQVQEIEVELQGSETSIEVLI